jgi:V/A-type H+-transporting ATPase subunit D
MPRINVPPTRSSLLQLKNDLNFVRQGYEILDRKREVLANELIRMAHDTEVLEEQVSQALSVAYKALEKAKQTMGQEHVEWAALAVNKTVDIQIKFHGVMGVPIPRIEARGSPPEMPYSLGDTTAALDEANAAFREVLAQIPELSMLETAVWRLAGELRKTQRRVNALQYIFIPDYEQTINFIENVLDENEREEIFHLKFLKAKENRSAIKPSMPEERGSHSTNKAGGEPALMPPSLD